MTIKVPEPLESKIIQQAATRGMSADRYVRELVERDLATTLEKQSPEVPFKSPFGILAKYGPAPSAEEIDENRADMFRNFGDSF